MRRYRAQMAETPFAALEAGIPPAIWPKLDAAALNELDIRAEADVQGLNATVIVGGTGLRPEITFASVPQLPQDERGAEAHPAELADEPGAEHRQREEAEVLGHEEARRGLRTVELRAGLDHGVGVDQAQPVRHHRDGFTLP